jgi:hypothetical protein
MPECFNDISYSTPVSNAYCEHGVYPISHGCAITHYEIPHNVEECPIQAKSCFHVHTDCGLLTVLQSYFVSRQLRELNMNTGYEVQRINESTVSVFPVTCK